MPTPQPPPDSPSREEPVPLESSIPLLVSLMREGAVELTWAQYPNEPWWPAITMKSWEVLRRFTSLCESEPEGPVGEGYVLAFFLGEASYEVLELKSIAPSFTSRDPCRITEGSREAYKRALEQAGAIDKTIKEEEEKEKEIMRCLLERGEVSLIWAFIDSMWWPCVAFKAWELVDKEFSIPKSIERGSLVNGSVLVYRLGGVFPKWKVEKKFEAYESKKAPRIDHGKAAGSSRQLKRAMAEAQSLKAGTIRGLSSDLTGPAAAVGVRRANQQAAAKITELVAPTTRNVAAKTGLVDKGGDAASASSSCSVVVGLRPSKPPVPKKQHPTPIAHHSSSSSHQDIPPGSPLHTAPFYDARRSIGQDEQDKLVRLIDGLLRLPDLVKDGDGLPHALRQIKAFIHGKKEVDEGPLNIAQQGLSRRKRRMMWEVDQGQKRYDRASSTTPESSACQSSMELEEACQALQLDVEEFVEGMQKRKKDLVVALSRLRDRPDHGQLVQEQLAITRTVDQALQVFQGFSATLPSLYVSQENHTSSGNKKRKREMTWDEPTYQRALFLCSIGAEVSKDQIRVAEQLIALCDYLKKRKWKGVNGKGKKRLAVE